MEGPHKLCGVFYLTAVCGLLHYRVPDSKELRRCALLWSPKRKPVSVIDIDLRAWRWTHVDFNH